MIRFYSFLYGFLFLFHIKNYVILWFNVLWMQKIIIKPVCETACSISHFIFIYHLASCTLQLAPPPASSAKSKEGIIPTGFQCERVPLAFSTIFTFRLLFIIYWPLLMFAFHNCSQFSVAWIWWFIRIIFRLKFMIQSINATLWVPTKFHFWMETRRFGL